MKKQDKDNKERPQCPHCGKSDKVGNVISSKGKSGAVVYRKFCRNCLIEFDLSGVMIPPLYK